MKRLITCLAIFYFLMPYASAQGFAFGIKGGPSLGFQKWNNVQRDPLWAGHLIAYIETLSTEGEVGLFAQAGFHQRGSAVRIRSFNYNDPATGSPRSFDGNTTKYNFNNLSLSLGAKQRFPNQFGNYYYMLGLRGDYNISNSFSDFNELPLEIRPFFPLEGGVNDFTFGFIFGGGVEFTLGQYVDAIAELTVNPDYTKQYYQPEFSVRSPYTNTNVILQERNIRNVTLELTVGFRFLRVVEYIDEGL